jgi:hypothetical protein
VPGAPSLWHKVVTAGAGVALAVTPVSGAPVRSKGQAAKPAPTTVTPRQDRAQRRSGPAPWVERLASEALRP